MASANSVWKRLLGVEKDVVVEDWDFNEAGTAFVVKVRVSRRSRRRCSQCGKRRPLYDRGAGVRRWRGLDLGATQVFLVAELPRVKCPDHGVVVSAVPWARARSRFTRQMEDQCAWLAVHTNRTAVAELNRVAWKSVGRIVERVGTEAQTCVDLLSNLRRIGIDELSHRTGQKYVTTVIDHDTGRLVWMAPGRDRATLQLFFDALGEERATQLQLVSADGARWIDEVVAERAPQAERCMDTFHVVQWATEALDKVRREVWNKLRESGDADAASHLKGARWALWKNPENLTAKQKTTLAWVQKVNAPLYRAYLLKEQLRAVFQQPTAESARQALRLWLRWACRSRLKSFVALAKSIRERHLQRIEATLEHGPHERARRSCKRAAPITAPAGVRLP